MRLSRRCDLLRSNGKVHGGAVMKWIGQAAYSGAINLDRRLRERVPRRASIFSADSCWRAGRVPRARHPDGRTRFDITVDVYAGNLKRGEWRRTCHCVIVFVAVDAEGKPFVVPMWQSSTSTDRTLERYARRLAELRQQMDAEMERHLSATADPPSQT